MPRIRFLTFVLVLGVIVSACSEGREDPLGVGDEILTEGKLSTDGDGPNLMINSENTLGACQTVNEVVFNTFIKTVLTRPAASETVEAVRIMGDYSGYLVVDGSVTLSGTSLLYDIKVTFFDYSDSGSVYIGGALSYVDFLKKVSDDWFSRDAKVTGLIKVAGPYSGYFQYNGFLLPADD